MDTNLSARDFIPAHADQPPLSTRTHRVWLALSLALMVATTTGIPPAQAASTTRISFEVSAAPRGPLTLCVGKQQRFYVSIQKYTHAELDSGFSYDSPGGTVTEVSIHAASSNKTVGIVEPPETSTAAPGVDQLAPLTTGNLGDADFVFSARKKGTTTVTFKADSIPPRWLGSSGTSGTAREATVQIKVRNCKFRVKTVSQWHLQGDASAFDISALMSPLELTADEQGNLQGSARVNGLGSATYPGCTGVLSVKPSQADLTGKLLESGQLELNITFTAVASSVTFTCPTPLFTGVAGRDDTGTPEALAVSMPDSGGVITQSQQIITIPPGAGSVNLIVIPIDAGGTASSPRPGSSLAWWTTLWQNPLGLLAFLAPLWH